MARLSDTIEILIILTFHLAQYNLKILHVRHDPISLHCAIFIRHCLSLHVDYQIKKAAIRLQV